jgi:hypothetical protein
MGQRTKGKMWCKVCGPVLGVKNTHRIRNASSLLLPLGPLLFSKVEGYYCPKCGARVHPAWMGTGDSANRRLEGWWVNRTQQGASEVLPPPLDERIPVLLVTPDHQWMTYDGHYKPYTPPPAP